METIVLVFGTAFQAAAFRLHHGDLKLGVFAKRAFRQSLEREHERVFDGLGHLSNRQAHLQHARRTGLLRRCRHRIHHARHDSQFVHGAPSCPFRLYRSCL